MSAAGEQGEPRPEGRVAERVPGAEAQCDRCAGTILRGS